MWKCTFAHYVTPGEVREYTSVYRFTIEAAWLDTASVSFQVHLL